MWHFQRFLVVVMGDVMALWMGEDDAGKLGCGWV